VSSDPSAPPAAPRAPAVSHLLPYADGYSYRELGIAFVLATVLSVPLQLVLRPAVGEEIARVVTQAAQCAVFFTGLAQTPGGRSPRELIGAAARLFAVTLPVSWLVWRWLS